MLGVEREISFSLSYGLKSKTCAIFSDYSHQISMYVDRFFGLFLDISLVYFYITHMRTMCDDPMCWTQGKPEGSMYIPS